MNALRGLALSLALALCLATCAAIPSAPPSSPPSEVASPAADSAAAAAFDGGRARVHVAYLADPARRGRLTGSAGYRAAAEYVAARFRDLGLLPGGDDGTYFQRFAAPLVELTAMSELAVLSPDAVRFKPRADFTESVGGWAGGGSVEAELVAVARGRDEDYRGIDVRGRVVLVTGLQTQSPVEIAARQGARAAIVVLRDSAGPLLHFSYLPSFTSGAIPTIAVRETVADRLLVASGKRAADLRTPGAESFLTPSTVRVSVPLGPVQRVDGINVVGVLPPVPGDARFVVVGGHLDGVGTDPDGTVYSAANDNASGPSMLLELARAAAATRERRHGVVFVAFAGEEEGSTGALEFLRRSADTPYRPQNVVAMVNLDVVGCCGDTLLAAGQNQSLVQRFAAAAQRNAVPLSSSRGASTDHVVFEQAGLPAATLLWRDNGPIHTPADTLEIVDAEHLRRAGAVATAVVLELAAD